MDKENYTKVLTEKIYKGTNKNEFKDNAHQMKLFFEMLYKRRREDPFEGGFQACALIMPDAFAAKANENDGLGIHGVEYINLLRYLQGNSEYFTSHGYGYFYLHKKETEEIILNGIEVRILDGQDKLMLAITSDRSIKSVFQLKVLKMIIDLCKQLKDKGLYQEVEVGINTPDIKIDFDEWTEDKFALMHNSLKDESNRLA